jgi:Dynamin GTPase effector domain
MVWPREVKILTHSSKALGILDTVAKNTRALIESYCKWECRRPLTHNYEDLESCRWQALAHLLHQRYGMVVKQGAENDDTADEEQQPLAEGLEALCDLVNNPKRVTAKELEEKFDADAYRPELETAGSAISYFRVAYKRVIDIIPMCIENEFLLAFGLELRDNVENCVGLVGDSAKETCAKFATEDPDVRDKRHKLTKTRDTLVKALEIVDGIGQL